MMFLDSSIANSFALSNDKCSYLINYGLALYFNKCLINQINESLHYVML